MKWIENDNGKIVLTKAGKANKLLHDLYNSDHTSGSVRFRQNLKWLFFVYSEDKENPYKGYFPEERKEKVFEREFADIQKLTIKQLDQRLAEVIKEYVYFHTSDIDRLITGVRKQIQKYLEFFNTVDIDHDNYPDIQKRILGATGLIQYRETLEKEKEKEKANYRGGKRVKKFELTND